MTIFNFEMLNVPFANGAISTEIAPFPDWNRGLGIAFDQTEGKPEMKGLNGLFQVLTTSMLYLKQRGIAEWDAALEYPANAFVTDGAKLYKSKRTNTNKQPSLSQLDWDVWASISDISVSTNGNLKKTVAADGSVTLEVPTASDSQRGAVRQATSTEVANNSNVNAYINPYQAASIVASQVPALGIKASCRVLGGASPYFSGNIGFSSVVRVATGIYEFTLSTPMPSSAYMILASCSNVGGNGGASSANIDSNFAQTTSKFRLRFLYGGDNTQGTFDPSLVNVAVIY